MQVIPNEQIIKNKKESRLSFIRWQNPIIKDISINKKYSETYGGGPSRKEITLIKDEFNHFRIKLKKKKGEKLSIPKIIELFQEAYELGLDLPFEAKEHVKKKLDGLDLFVWD